VPSDLRKYLEYTAQIKAAYGSVMQFVVKERLGWGDGNTQDLQPKGGPFEFEGMLLLLPLQLPLVLKIIGEVRLELTE
jgi:hypothetical protein